MGLQHGELLRDEIRSLIDAVYHHVLYGQPGVAGWGIRRAVRTVAGIMASQIAPRYREEMRGVAHAADVPYADIVLVNSFDDVLANLRLLGTLFGRLGCSTFAVLPSGASGGALVCGRNLDYFVESAAGDDPWAATRFMKEHLTVTEFAPTDRQSFVAVGWPGFVGTVTAMSCRGVVVGSLSVPTLRNTPFATPAPFLYRSIVEQATTVDEAVDLMRRTRRTQGNNVLVGSASDRAAAVVEFTARRLAVRHPEHDWIVATNHFAHPDLAPRSTKAPFFSSSQRFMRLHDLCRSAVPNGFDAARAREFLTDITRWSPDANEYCTILNPCTVYSTVFAPSEGRMWVRAADRVDREYEEVEIPLS